MGKSLIVTFHCVPNYGAALQVLALQNVLTRLSSYVSILNYQPKALTAPYKLFNTHSIKSIILSLYNIRGNWRRNQKFKRFQRRYLQIATPAFKDPDKVYVRDYDYVFLGSDQIWNPLITGGYDKIYFGDFATNNNCKRISYAASVGISSLNEEQKGKLKNYIAKVDHVSVRENNASEILSTLTSAPIDVVLDPTLLVERKEWDQFKVDKEFGRYLLLYSLSDYDETREIAKRVAQIMNLKIIEISTKNRKPFESKRNQIINTADPSEFLGLINAAEFVVTDSFHGTVFSIIYHKPFYTIPNKTKGSRMIELLNKIGLSDRLITDTEKFKCSTEIEYNKVDKILDIERSKSIEFIRKAMSIDNE